MILVMAVFTVLDRSEWALRNVRIEATAATAPEPLSEAAPETA
jgi:hypothetical protein